MMKSTEALQIPGRLFVPYANWVGWTASRFLRDLRDKGRLRGTRCPACGKVFLPPRSVCSTCLAPLESWVDLPGTGLLMTFTSVHYSFGEDYQPMDPPYLLGIIRLDGADTGICHFLGETSIEELRVGMKVQAVLRKEREGSILDIAYFKPIRLDFPPMQ